MSERDPRCFGVLVEGTEAGPKINVLNLQLIICLFGCTRLLSDEVRPAQLECTG
jgi:hypothetical protein